MNDINLLMSRIDTINAITNPRDLTPNDIDTLIAYHRRNRARKAAGEKLERPSRPALDISTILNLPTSRSPSNGVPFITRRI